MAFTPEEYVYECPLGCKHSGNLPIAATVRGWKRHMTSTHEGWTNEQLEAACGTGPKNSEAGRAIFLGEADSGEPARDNAKTPQVTPGPPSPEKLAEIKTDAAAKKLNAKMSKIKRQFAEKIPQMLNAALLAKGPEWTMDQGDMDMVTESVESCFDMLEINFQIAPIGATLKNPLWVLIYPLVVLCAIFIVKAVKNAPENQAESK
jgi:hypothetical protein